MVISGWWAFPVTGHRSPVTYFMFHLAFTIQSDTRYLAPLRQFVAAAAEIVGRNRFSKRLQTKVSLALIEAVDNAIFHAHRRKAVRPIDVVLKVSKDSIRIEVSDRGRGLDHPVVADPASFKSRGRGLYIMGSAMGGVKSVIKNRKHWVKMSHSL